MRHWTNVHINKKCTQEQDSGYLPTTIEVDSANPLAIIATFSFNKAKKYTCTPGLNSHTNTGENITGILL